MAGPLALATLLGSAGTARGDSNAPYFTLPSGRLWQSHLPDYFQHQKWGNNAADPARNDKEWETQIELIGGIPTPVPAGWCKAAATVQCFAVWRRLGFGGLLPAAIDADATWLENANAQIKKYATGSWDVEKEIKDRGHGPDAAAGKRLGFAVYSSIGGVVNYRNARGDTYPLKLFGAPVPIGVPLAAEFAGGATVLSIVERGAVGPFSPDLWWDFHALPIAGIDLFPATVIVADPDSNRGNADADAGWSGTWPDAAVNGRKYAPWDPAGGPNDLRPIPAPGGLFADPAGYATHWMPLQLKLDLQTVDDTVAANARYKNIAITRLEVIRPLAAAPKQVGMAPAPGATSHLFELGGSPGNPISELWLVPNASLEVDAFGCAPTAFAADGELQVEVTVEVVEPTSIDRRGRRVPTLDPHGQPLVERALRIHFEPPIDPLAVVDLAFCTEAPFDALVDGYDVFIRDRSLEMLLAEHPELPSDAWGGAAQLHLAQSVGVAVQWPVLKAQAIDVCLGDFDADGEVGGADLGLLLSAWGASEAFDLDGDGLVGGADLGILLALWGDCAAQSGGE